MNVDLTYSLSVARRMPYAPARLYQAWTTGWGAWFAEPGSLHMHAVIGAPFRFDVTEELEDGSVRHHPHYGRFLDLRRDELIVLSWVTRGTDGVETTVTVELTPHEDGCDVALSHAGFASERARDQHADAWPIVLEHLDASLQAQPDLPATSPAISAMAVNRSIPDSTFIPVRSYPDLDAAVAWLRDVLGCRERLRIPGHRVQLTLGNGAVVAVAWDASTAPATGGRPPATLMVRVSDIDATYARALASGATGLSEPTNHPYGERQASVRDPAGHAWTLTQTIDDVDPASWGAKVVS